MTRIDFFFSLIIFLMVILIGIACVILRESVRLNAYLGNPDTTIRIIDEIINP